jgi:hypothetical protein
MGSGGFAQGWKLLSRLCAQQQTSDRLIFTVFGNIQYLDHLERFLAINSSSAAIASRFETDSFQWLCGLDVVCLSRGVDSAWLDCWRRRMRCMHFADQRFCARGFGAGDCPLFWTSSVAESCVSHGH